MIWLAFVGKYLKYRFRPNLPLAPASPGFHYFRASVRSFRRIQRKAYDSDSNHDSTLNRGQSIVFRFGIWLYFCSSGTSQIYAIFFSTHFIIYTGWNWIGYCPLATQVKECIQSWFKCLARDNKSIQLRLKRVSQESKRFNSWLKQVKKYWFESI